MGQATRTFPQQAPVREPGPAARHATFGDGSTKRLFSFFPDEVSFQPSEFTGLTEEEAHSLFQRKETNLRA